MNQFVNQLSKSTGRQKDSHGLHLFVLSLRPVLGNPLYGSTGAPSYNPLWMDVSTWVFAAQVLPFLFHFFPSSL
jgi:hypothetical protein